ncbi:MULTISPECIES: VTT domain-containing protein [Leuconostoc]|uniref:Cytochrome O ubiquinol oxidase n=1 Tax=Leuconostoc carnosum TaxID=1252 RepID=A0AAE6IIL2_LEUCA|nr:MULTISPECIES: VTT domain-containing protein [Leuconostoc]KAA8326086.1 cytochrome O ubiquinol oxidase [Leuconostoc carnosum]KAA8330290.1 cytochrome O ubiquinol oxidase [Leuconostoc carnosum]KAA8370655.1 cytochrome O ubiquinol oxidase [Leuconostoc carnosum]KAA8373918.1 cytochrome O ubiquinol oxidase [Leuconostoc carnosum]KAA8375884.1 cytochrome O ubiquinol oxidase [Leuconostoc carnosum]
MFLIDFILHIDAHIATLVSQFGPWTYLILFLIIFIETGIVIMPFLPGDSLLFAAGAVAATPAGIHAGLNHWVFMLLFFFAATIGDSLNFWIGRTGGYKLVRHPLVGRFIKEEHIREAEGFFEKRGALAIIIGRYMPIVRTFVPFVAGISQFSYGHFLRNNIIAAFSWSLIATGAGYLFGNIPFVKAHFSIIILGIALVTLMPTFIGIFRSVIVNRRAKKITQNIK